MKNFIKVLPAANGDCIIINFVDNETEINILIDGGRGRHCHRKLKQELEQIRSRNKNIDLMVITHTDEDHIAGINKLFSDSKFDKSILKNVWFNSGSLISKEILLKEDEDKAIPLFPEEKKMSIRQGITLEKALKETNCWHDEILCSEKRLSIEGLEFSILSPDQNTLSEFLKEWEIEDEASTKMSSITDHHIQIEDLFDHKFNEDPRLANKTSIAFLLEYNKFKLLMLGDAHPSVIISSLKSLGYTKHNKLKVDVMKVSHHGSRGNTSEELMELIECEKYIISTDGSNHGFPHKECLAKIIKFHRNPIKLYFNYSTFGNIFSQDEIEEYGIECIFLDNERNYSLEV